MSSSTEGLSELAQELTAADDDLRGYLRHELKSLVTNCWFLDVVEGFLPAGPASRTEQAVGIMRRFSATE